MELSLYIYLYIIVTGLIMGSFLCCWAYRVCHNDSILKGHSKCDNCGRILKTVDLIPVVSYLLSKGRCRYCNSRINVCYPLGEIVCAVAYFLIVNTFGLTVETLQYVILFSICLAISFSDIESYYVPPVFIIIGLLNRAVFILIYNIGVLNMSGCLVSIGVFMVSVIMKKITGKDVIGDGDIKLLFMLGMYSAWYDSVLALFVSSLLGLMFILTDMKKYKNRMFPFAPCICLGHLIILLINNI